MGLIAKITSYRFIFGTCVQDVFDKYEEKADPTRFELVTLWLTATRSTAKLRIQRKICDVIR